MSDLFQIKKANKIFIGIILALIILGSIIFISASLGLLARDGAKLGSVAFNQLFFGLFLGSVMAIIFSTIPYRIWGASSPWLFILSIILTFAVFIPGIGVSHNGATRWLALGPLTLQPAELLKITYIMFWAMWLSMFKKNISNFKHGLLAFLIISAIASLPLLIQPDTDNTFIMILTGAVMFFIAGARKRDIGIIVLIGIILATSLVLYRPYILERFTTFMSPEKNALGAGYQVQQSLIAIGSGHIFGKGFGQSVQKFNYLPEPTSDSIFAVASEEFGFLGAIIILILFILFLIKGLQIGQKSVDTFGGLLAIGIVIMIAGQSFLNMASMLSIFPLSGLPLPFISHGGTALFITLASIGIVLNISKYQIKT